MTLVPAPAGPPLRALWLGRIAYRDAWALQKRLAQARADQRIGDVLLLLEHDAVLTLGRTSDPSHIRAGDAELAARGIEVVRVERGGEVTYHGPGQLVAYPILELRGRGLLVRPFVRALEAALEATAAAFGVVAARRDGHPGLWIGPDGPAPRKVGALGVRIERGVSYHGIALNVDVALDDFALIDACGMPDVVSTSLAREAGRPDEPPTTAEVERAAHAFAAAFGAAIGASVVGPDAGATPADAHAELDRLLAAAAA